MIDRLKRHTTGVLAALAIAGVVAAPVGIHAASNSLTLPVVGTIPVGGTFSGTFTLTSFAVQNGQAVATGTLTGLLTTASGVTTTIMQTIAIPVTVGSTTCQILHLDIGPISLTLLGLQVNLSEIVLDITAQSGPGNLLGNLLCDVANLLNNPDALVKQLNQILAAL